jgi:hypothetical protein
MDSFGSLDPEDYTTINLTGEAMGELDELSEELDFRWSILDH